MLDLVLDLSVLWTVLETSLIFFIILEPIGSIPIFLSLTRDMSPIQRRKTLQRAVLFALPMLMVVAVVGHWILYLFKISLHTFMIAGGSLLFLVAIKLLLVGRWEVEAEEREEVSIFPIAIPLLTGPGAITTAMMMVQAKGIFITFPSILLAFVGVALVFRFIEPLYKILGKHGSNGIGKVMAIFIAAIAVNFVLTGIQHYF